MSNRQRNSKSKVSKRTYNGKVKKYAKVFNTAFKDLVRFVETKCKGGKKKSDSNLDIICEIVDRYINLNSEAREWSYKNGIDHDEFTCDIMNTSFNAI